MTIAKRGDAVDAPETELLLMNRAFLYALVARGFAEEPDGAFFEVLESAHALEHVALADDGEGVLSSCFAAVSETASNYGVASAAQEYVRLFVGPQAPKVAPYESAFLSGGRTLFQPGSLQVRDAYLASGFIPAWCRRVPDDFLGIEFDFMAKLAQRACEAWGCGTDSDCRDALVASRDFLEGHLLKWAGQFAGSLGSEYGECLYSRFARLSAAVAKRDSQMLAKLLESRGYSGVLTL